MERGKYILFEGGEGSGKSTQILLLCKDFEERKIGHTHTREPGGTIIGEKIRDLLIQGKPGEMTSETELLLFVAQRAELYRKLVPGILEEGRHLIQDRGFMSTRAYQGYGRGISLDVIDYMNDFVMDGINPDLTFVFDLPVELGLKRAFSRRDGKEVNRFEREVLEFHNKLREGYLEMAGQNEDCVLIDMVVGSKMANVNEIHELVKYHVKNRLGI